MEFKSKIKDRLEGERKEGPVLVKGMHLYLFPILRKIDDTLTTH